MLLVTLIDPGKPSVQVAAPEGELPDRLDWQGRTYRRMGATRVYLVEELG